MLRHLSLTDIKALPSGYNIEWFENCSRTREKKDIVNKTGEQIKLSTACLPMESELNLFCSCALREFGNTDFEIAKKKEADSLPAISDFIKSPLEVKYCDLLTILHSCYFVTSINLQKW